MPASKFTKKANTPKRKRQWQHVYDAEKKAGKSERIAIMAANAAVKKATAKTRRKKA